MNKTILHWSYHNLTSIPTELLDYKELEEVYLKENFIASIPQWLLKLINLKFIHLLGNLIREIPENIYYLENLEFLDLSNNRLSFLPESIGKLKNLKRFNIGGNEIRILPKEIGDLIQLETLDISANLLKYIPEEIARLKNLREINLNDNNFLKTLPNNFFLLPKLDNLYTDRCGLIYLPAVLSPSVSHIRIFNNRLITHIPICYLKHIQRFYDLPHTNNDSFEAVHTQNFIREEETFRKLIFPFYLRRIHNTKERIVPSFYEISLAKLKEYDQDIRNDNVNIPRSILKAINNGPTTLCSNTHCQRFMYTEVYLVLVKRVNSTSKLIFSCTFCSIECKESWFLANKSDYYTIEWNIL